MASTPFLLHLTAPCRPTIMSSRNWFLGCARFSWRRTPLIATQSQGGSQQKENESGVRTQAWSEIKAVREGKICANKLDALLHHFITCHLLHARPVLPRYQIELAPVGSPFRRCLLLHQSRRWASICVLSTFSLSSCRGECELDFCR